MVGYKALPQGNFHKEDNESGIIKRISKKH